jgi:cytochrome c-type biogenesis protein CcmH/NrfG
MKLGVPLVLQYDLSTAWTISPSMAAGESNAAQLGANQIMRTTVESRQGRIHLEATILDEATQKNVSVNSAEASSAAELLPALNALAKRIDGHASKFATEKIETVQTMASAAAATNLQTRVQFLGRAVQADPTFGAGYVALLEIISRSSNQNIKSLIAEAQTNRKLFMPFDQTKFEMVVTRLRHASRSEQAKAAEAVLQLAPNDVEALELLGVVRFLEGDASGGENALRRALGLSPANVNLQNQLALGLLGAKRFSAAEKILAAMTTNPASRLELAVCILLEGDAARASTAAEHFFTAVPNAEVRSLVRAFWLAISGQRPKAIESLANAKFADSNLKASALGETAVWRVMNKDFAGAKKDAALSAAADTRPGSPVPIVAALLADSDEAAGEWQKKVAAAKLGEDAKETLLGYGYFLNRHYAEASAAWRPILERSRGADLRARAMLKGSLERAHDTDEAHKIEVLAFVPEFGDLYGVISFDEMRRQLK